MIVFDDPLPRADSGGSTVTEVLVISHGVASDENAREALQAALHDMSAPIPADADAEALEARRLALLAEGQKIATMRCLMEAHQREVDRAAFGTPPPEGPSRVGIVKKRGAAIANMLGADRPVYAMPLENLRTAQSIVDELNGLGADELPYMTRRIQQLIDAAAT